MRQEPSVILQEGTGNRYQRIPDFPRAGGVKPRRNCDEVGS